MKKQVLCMRKMLLALLLLMLEFEYIVSFEYIEVEELSSTQVAAQLLKHGAPKTLANAVLTAALDGTQLHRYPLLQQFVLDAVKSPKSDIRDAPVEITRHEVHQHQHERLARGSTNVRNTTTTGKTKMERWRESVRPAYQQSIASDNLPSSGRANGGASGKTQDKSADTITLEETMRGVIAHWYTNYSAVDQSYNPIPVSTIPGVLDMATSQTMAAGLVFQNFNTHSAGSPWEEATATKTAQLEIEEGRNSSVHRCKGTLKSQCLLFDVCFALDHHAGSSTTT